MLIRISGGEEGIKEYLEDGHKQGREFSRDELDERVILAGDLDFTNQIIQGIEKDGERYLHITLSFKEDEISNETLRAIAEEFRRFMFSAYKDDEYNFYAEAHLPKIKSYEHQTTGEVVERKPHIHIVVPKINLRTGGALNPFGLVERSERHIDAAQEHINNKFGLASPKDNRRVQFTDASDMILRYRDHNFAGAKKDFKQSILQAVLERDITSYDEFKNLIAEFGDVRVRNSGKPNEYLNVKYAEGAARDDLAEHRFTRKFKHVEPGSAKGVNLKEEVFSRTFIELPDSQKRAVLSAEIQRTYDVAGEARKDPANIAAALDEWHRFRAKEIKYLNSGNKPQYKAYRAAAPDAREEILAQLEAKFYSKYPEPSRDPDINALSPFRATNGLKQLPPDPHQVPLVMDADGRPSLEQPVQVRRDGPAAATRQNTGLPIERTPASEEYDLASAHRQDDPLTSPPGRFRDAIPLSSLEQSLTTQQQQQAPATGRVQPTSAQILIPYNHQEHHHERERQFGTRSIDNVDRFRPPGGQRPWAGAGSLQAASRPGQRQTREYPRQRGGSPPVRAGRPQGADRRGPGFDPDRERGLGTAGSVGAALPLNDVRAMPGGRMVSPVEEGPVLLPRVPQDQLGNGRSRPDPGVRRRRDRRRPVVAGTGRVDDSVVSQVARDFGERQSSGTADALPEIQEIKQQLDARRLLAELSRSHGIIVEKYKVTTAADGSPRIRAGSRNLNVADFLTKEVRLPWAEAATILRRTYSRQVDRHPNSAPRVPPDRDLWRQFQEQRRGRGSLRAQLAAQVASEKARRQALKEQLAETKRAAAALPAGQRKAAMSIARMEAIAAENTLKSAIRAERAPFRLPVADQYRIFLQERAQDGSPAALAELRRRSRSAPILPDPAVGQIRAAEPSHEPNGILYRGRQVRYRVHLDGDVVYSIAGRPIIQDKGNSVLLLRTDRLTIETALRLAHEKFGTNLALSGPAEFHERAATIAAEAGLDVRFDNKHAEQIREQRATELATQRAAGRRFVYTLATPKPGAGKDARAAPRLARDPQNGPTPGQSTDDPEVER